MSQLFVRLVTSTPIWTDHDSKASSHCAIYQPNVPDGWFWLGHLAQWIPSDWKYTDSRVSQLAPLGIVVQAAAASPGALGSVQSSPVPNPLWTDQHSHGDENILIYEPVPEDTNNYAMMGLFALSGDDLSYSSADPTKDPTWSTLRAVRKDLLTEAAGVVFAWNDHHTGANGSGTWKDIALWTPHATEGFVAPQTFVATGNYDVPSSTQSTPKTYQFPTAWFV